MNPSAIALVVLAFGLAGCSGGEAGSSMSGQPPVDAERIAHERTARTMVVAVRSSTSCGGTRCGL